MTHAETQAVDTPAPDEDVSQLPVEDTTQEEAGNEAESSPAVNDSDDSGERKKGVAKRIDELTRLRYDAERERDHWRQMAMREKAIEPAPEPEKPKALPKLEDFNYDEAAYQAALITHATDEAERKVLAKLDAQRAQQQKAERTRSWRTRESEFEATHPDYKEKAHYAPVSDAMVELIQESENGPELAYFLGNNRDIAERIAALNPVHAARELGRIEAKLEKPALAPKPAVSKAPPPPPKIEAIDAAPSVRTTDSSGDALSDEEWVRAEKKRISRKR